MLLIAHRQLTGVYGTVAPGDQFNCPDDIAKELIHAGLVHKADPPKILYETKVITPPEVGPTQPFPYMPLSDARSEGVVDAGDPMLSGADISKQGNADSGRRQGRPRSNSR